jgi:hypothetical protein
VRAQEAPDARQIIGGAKMVAALQQADLEGTMSRGHNKVPVALFLRNKDIQFQYWQTDAWRKFHLRMNDDLCELFEMINDQQAKFPVSRLATPIAGMDLSYEDLAMRFFYWKNPVLEGAERVGVHNCWKIRLNNPGQGGAYQVMYVWVHQKYGAFMKIEGFNRQGQILKRFEVIEVMNIGKNPAGQEVYTLEQPRQRPCAFPDEIDFQETRRGCPQRTSLITGRVVFLPRLRSAKPVVFYPEGARPDCPIPDPY